MISAKINGSEVSVSMEIEGSVNSIVSELCLMIHNLYKHIAEKDDDAANEFKFLLQQSVKEDFLFAKKDKDVIIGIAAAMLSEIFSKSEDE